MIALALALGGMGVLSGPLLDRAVRIWIAKRSQGAAAPVRSSAWRSLSIALTTGLVESLAAVRIGATWSLPPDAAFLAAAIALGWCDAEHLLLPRHLQHATTLVAGGLVGIAAAATGDWHRAAVAVACGAAAFGAFLLVNLLSAGGLAFGDVRFAGSVGLVVGWSGTHRVELAFAIATVLGALSAAVLVAAGRAERDTKLPYGVFLAAGAAAALLF